MINSRHSLYSKDEHETYLYIDPMTHFNLSEIKQKMH